MIQRMSLAAVIALSLSTLACAAEEGEAETGATGIESAAETASAQDAAPAAAPAPDAAAPALPDFPEEAWRRVDQEDLLYIQTSKGLVVVELAPEFAPNHVERMTSLARERFYDFLVWHRVIEDFMAQGGGARSNPNHGTDKPNLEAEFTTRRTGELTITELQDRVINPRAIPALARAGFWNGFPAGTQPVAQAMLTADGRVESWLLHCPGAAAMARTNDPNSAGSQFYLTRVDTSHLNATYTVWGKIRHGQEVVDSLNNGTLGQDMGYTPDVIESMRVGTELDAGDQMIIDVADTNSDAFAAYLDTLRDPAGELPDICEITVPVRINP